MRKLFLTFAIIAGFVSAPVSLTNATNNEIKIEIPKEELSFSSISVSNLPIAVKNAALKATEGMMAITEAKMATTEKGLKIYEVILNDGQDSETTLFYNEDGSRYKD